MGDAICGPSNPLQNFQKQTQADRTLQQDRLASRSTSSSQGFRSSPGPNAGILDQEFEAFQAGYSPAAATPEFQQSYHYQLPPAAASGWASDFQRLNISHSSSPVPQFHLGLQTLPDRNAQLGLYEDYLREQDHLSKQRSIRERSQSSNLQHHRPAAQQQIRGINMNQYAYQGSSLCTPMRQGPQNESITQQKQPQQEADDVFDEAAFEKAFEAASSEISQSHQEAAKQENMEFGQDVLINESAERLMQSDHLIEQVRLGADLVPRDERRQQQEGPRSNDADELARTAGQLLDSVKDNQSQKFQESTFLELMRRLRDREVVVEGDKMVDNTQSVGQGDGDSYNTVMTGAIDPDDDVAAQTQATA
ncbi:MAG: hypothetical protein M1827_003253 [Pycnora praestabilis]|nr:MAG: hypothetical protein M1827_003253 [Pycnora praestabilis]